MFRAAARRLILVAALLSGIAVLPPAASAREARASAAVERGSALLRPAVVIVETFWTGYVLDEEGEYFNDGEPFEFSSSCSGFVVSPAAHVVTAGHCVDDSRALGGAERALIEMAAAEAAEEPGGREERSVSRLVELGLTNWTVKGPEEEGGPRREVRVKRAPAPGREGDEAVPARIVDHRNADSGDVALLEVEARNWPSVVLGGPRPVDEGTPVLAVGFAEPSDQPADMAAGPVVEQGAVTGKETHGAQPVYEISASLAEGMSGGPTGDLEGEVIGVNSFGTREGEPANFAVPVGNVHEMLTGVGARNELGPVDRAYRRALEDFFAGRYAAASSAFDEVLEMDPENQTAREFAEESRKAAPADTELPRLSMLAGALGAAAVIGLSGGMFIRARSRRPGGERSRPPEH